MRASAISGKRWKQPSQAETFYCAAIFLKLGDAVMESYRVIGGELHENFKRSAAKFGSSAIETLSWRNSSSAITLATSWETSPSFNLAAETRSDGKSM